jgi:hypothetical protein
MWRSVANGFYLTFSSGQKKACCFVSDHRYTTIPIQGYSKKSIHFQKFILQKLLKLNPCPVCGWKGNLSKLWSQWSKTVHHWGCGCCNLWNDLTSVGRAGLKIWHLPRWGSHRVLVRCENNFESFLFSLYVAYRHMFNSTWKYIFEIV